MWTELTDPRQIEFYREFHEGRREQDEDWMPMVRAIEYLQSQHYAKDLYAFTSLVHFQVTTARTYQEQAGHSCVGITWNYRRRSFGLTFWAFDRHNGDTQKDIIICAEDELPSAVDALILRLGRE